MAIYVIFQQHADRRLHDRVEALWLIPGINEEIDSTWTDAVDPDKFRIVARHSLESDFHLFLRVFQDIKTRYPEWKTIKVHDVRIDHTLLLEIIAPKGEPGGIYVEYVSEKKHPGDPQDLVLTRTPPRQTVDRVDMWRRHLPPKGILSLTEAAVRRIVEVRDHLQQEEPDKTWIPTLSWGAGHVVDPLSGKWRQLEERFTLGFFPKGGDYPEEAIENIGGIDMIARLNTHLSRFDGKKVDYRLDGGGFVLIDKETSS